MVSTFALCKFFVISSLFLTTCLSSLFRPISYYYKLNILPDIYELHGKANSTHSVKRYICRNVPGHGSCLFYALSSCITYERSKQHIDFSKRRMKDMVSNLRKKAVEVLKSKDKELYVENGEKMTSEELLDMVASHFKTTPEKYCESMMDPSTWGSGTEIVALSNYLKRPIHVYELKVHRDGFLWRHKNFKFRLCAAFGSPVFDSNQPPYAILCADGRFPHVSPGAHKKTGDHFLALFPIEEPTFEQLRQDAERSIRKLEVDDSGGNDEFEFVSDGFSSTHRGGAKAKGVSRTRLQQHLRGLLPQSGSRGPRRHAGVTTLAATTVVKRKHKTDANVSTETTTTSPSRLTVSRFQYLNMTREGSLLFAQ